MEKTAQQTAEQGTLVGENKIESVDNSGGHGLDTPTIFSPGGSETPQEDSEQLSHGQQSYPGLRPGDPNNGPASDPPDAGDTDSADTKSATATGQDGDLSDPHKRKAFNYS